MRKKLFAILMSAMMMVTFMPAMAFAAEPADPTAKWASDYSAYTITYDGKDYPVSVTRTLITAPGNGYGMIKASVNKSQFASDTTTPAKVLAKLAATNDAYYYDVTGAKLLYKNAANVWVEMPTTFYKAGFESIFADTNGDGKYPFVAIEVAAPSYASNYKADATNPTAEIAKGAHSTKAMKNWTMSFAKPTAYDATSYAEQTFDVPVVFTAVNEVTGSYTYPDLIGAVSKTLKVAASKPLASEAKFYIDDEKTAWVAGDKTYDGAEHKIIMAAGEGLSVTYEKKNEAAGKWEAVDAPTWKDVVRNADGAVKTVTFRATVKDYTGGYAYPTFEVKVVPCEFQFGFENGIKVQTGQEFEAEDFIVIDPNEVLSTTAAAVVKKAIAANEDALKARFAEGYTVTKTPVKYSTDVKLAITYKFVTNSKEEKAFLKKYEALLNNVTPTLVNANKTIEVKDPEHNDVTTVDQTKTYKNKTGKLAKTWTFMCKGDFADYGTLSFYKTSGNAKITVAKDGKVTVKKGLKKGTYTVKIKVKAPNASAVKTLKVIVKK